MTEWIGSDWELNSARGTCLVLIESVKKRLGSGGINSRASILHSIEGVIVKDVDATSPIHQNL